MKFLRQIHKTSLHLNKSLDSNTTYKIIVASGCEIAKADFGSIYLKTGKKTLRRAFTNIPKKNRIRSREDGNTYSSLHKKKIIHLSEKELHKIHPESKDRDIKNILIIPMILDDESIGVITLSSIENMVYEDETKEKLQILAAMASIAIQNSYVHEQLQTRLVERDMFISMAAHELKTPLTSISGYAQISLSRLKKEKSVQKRHLQGIVNQVERLSQTITDFLSVENVRKGNLPFSFAEVSIFDVLESSVSSFKAQYPKHGVKLHLQPLFEMDDTWVWGDFHKLSQAISNILTNAGKYSPEKSTIDISSIETQKNVVITITDQGPGIASQDQHKIFDLFYRTGDTSESGKGIGLFLAKQIIDSHKGTITVDSKENTGSTFIIKLPTV